MLIQVLRCKIHRATVTAHDIEYEGSLTIDADLIRAAGLHVHEKIAVWNVTNGSRFETYVIEGEAGSGVVCVNGAAAHLTKKGDVIIIAAWGLVDAANRALPGSHPERPA